MWRFRFMFGWIVKLLGMRALKKAVTSAHGGRRPPIIDFGLGFALLKDRRVPVASKLLALMLGVVALMALTALELPVELIVAALLNLPGVGMDLVVDGIEIVAGPLLFGSLFLIRLA